ncbi:MAG: histidine phosphatase family protein [Acidobacteriota bacterium]|nr:histidine phosphatase family protein [Acidobacteriota bacterium]MDH3530424.1 histidine phosphatase family protein [Acidobacteriota bacterium]
MKTLFVLRHAKSSWDHPELSDFERPLNKRGKKAAPLIGAAMSERGYRPDIIISSPARRAKETTDLVTAAGEFAAVITFNQSIYGSGVNTLIHIVSDIPESAQSAMLVGHNPTFERLVEVLTGQTVRMPTAAVAVIGLDIPNWGETAAGMARLLDHLIPKDL